MREVIIIQSAHVEQGDAGVHLGFGVWRVEVARLGRMFISIKPDMKGAFHIRGATGDVDNKAVGIGAANRKSIGSGKCEDGGVILRGGAETVGELTGSQKVVVQGSAGAIDCCEETGKFR